MSKLLIHRNSEWHNKRRDFWIYIDEQKVDKISAGQTKVFNLDPGKHEIYAKIDWCGSEKFVVNISENKNFAIRMSGFKYGNMVLAAIFIVVLIYLLISLFLKIDLNFLLTIAGLAFLYPAYHFTFGKNKYIYISEINAEPSKKNFPQEAN